MKFSLKTLLLLLAVAAFTQIACKKDDDNSKSPEEILTSVSCWSSVKDELYNPTSNMWEDQAIDDCSKDDCLSFKSDKTATFDEGATKCDPADPQTSTGTWSLSADGKTLTSVIDGDTSMGTIIELTASQLIIEVEFFGIKFRSTLQPK